MKKFITLILCCLTPLISFGKWNGEPVTAIMADGSQLDGFTKTHLINYIKPGVSTIGISKEFKGKETKYTSREVAELIFPPAEGDSIYAIYHPVMAQKKLPNLLNKNPKTYKDPVFLRLIYNGENVKGYIRPCRDVTSTPSMTTVNNTWLYYYLVNGEEVARAYWVATRDIVPGMKKVMKFYFSEFPEMQQLINDEILTPKDFRSNPTIALPLIDAIIEARKTKQPINIDNSITDE